MGKEIYSKEASEFIKNLAELLKRVPEFEVPLWANFVKSGTSKQRPPVQDDFWYTRSASILRQLYIKGVCGVGTLRIKYGSKKNRGGRPEEFRKASGKIIRMILQQAEKAGLVEKLSNLQHGRRLTQKGRDFLDSVETKEVISLNFTNFIAKEKVNINENLNQEINEDGE